MNPFFNPTDYLSKDTSSASEREAKRMRHQAEQRAKICRAMVRVTARRGYAGASVHEALQVAGYGKAAYYRHYENRESCLLEAFERCAATLLEGVIAAAEEGDDVASRVGAALGTLVNLLGDNPDVAQVMLIEVRVGRRCRDAQQYWLGRFGELLEKCIATDAAAPDAEVARLMTGALLERLALSLREAPKGELTETLPDLIFIALLPRVGIESATTEMSRYGKGLSLAPRYTPRPDVTGESKRPAAGERSSKEELLARVESLSDEEAARARLIIEDGCHEGH